MRDMFKATFNACKSELTYNFTHTRSRETFLQFALVTLFGFGILAFLTSYITPLWIIFAVLAFSGFCIGILLHLSAWVVGNCYERGTFKSIKTGAQGVGILVLAAITMFYLFLGGYIVFGVFAVGATAIIPKAGIPLLMIFYIILSIWWAAEGMTFIESTGDGEVPPVGMFRKTRHFICELPHPTQPLVRLP